MIRKVLLCVFIFGFSLRCYSQDNSTKWGKKNFTYTNKELATVQSENGDTKSSSKSLVSPIIYLYGKTISEHDGDNCPFHPSCSSFFLDAVHQTDFISGILLFADRFTRDTNPVKSSKKNFLLPTGKLYDPVKKYLLKSEHFIFSPED
ncbi:MAG: membrane protein insertion efficiency factor YidD [Ignavibacteria bacterium]|nr:membrane protein insertion efficiency factor YidD [Ignavibacteria bacterium]